MPKEFKPKYLQGDQQTKQTKEFKRHERDVAKGLGGVSTVGSGAKGMKGDAWGGNRDAGQRIMAEAKATDKRSYSLKLDVLQKVVKEAFEANMEPVLYIRFEAGKSVNHQDWVVIPKHRYEELLETEAAYRVDKSG